MLFVMHLVVVRQHGNEMLVSTAEGRGRCVDGKGSCVRLGREGMKYDD